MSRKSAVKKKPEATWQLWCGVETVTIGKRPSGRPHGVMLVHYVSIMGSEREARKVCALNGGGTLVLRTGGRILKRVVVPAAARTEVRDETSLRRHAESES